MSSCLSGGSRTYGFDLDIVKPSSSSSSARSSHTSSPSSTLSESSHSSRTISIKKARTPRKRPHQTYNEAAALLSTIYPNIFFTKKSSRNISKQTKLFGSFSESCSELLPPFPVPGDAAFLIRESSPEKPAFRIEPTLKSSFEKKSTSSVGNEFREPSSPDPLEEDFDAESILDEEAEEGIDSIMGNLSMNAATNADDKEELTNDNSHINPSLRSLMGFGLGGKLELGFGFQFRRDLHRALRHSDDREWWSSPTVPMQEIVPKFKTSTPSSEKKKKKKKKVEKEEVGDMQTAAAAKPGNLKSGLGLKLNHEEVLKAWSGHGSVFADGPDSPHSSAEALAKLADIDLFPEAGGGGGVREASVLRYKEKRRTRLFSKKIRYQVRKVNADRRPRMKGRFVKRPSLLQQALEGESQ
ncbi:protein CHLOROPLAST IMPORT APPARATUS 2-like isoform X2 [Phoenix dactylifera]|uniref:Protein CHLOROPLAST IMPORT APPARATUS 2-like isoform X2 n=1 Tax=Phoenix dactylifera TaxID=42345 RepID=A0A8B7CHR5_PHODC|nr:protein CHLOROPLAST IMPORT APPARATUS 2-like isoform X2 [Phoenix dactylifera]